MVVMALARDHIVRDLCVKSALTLGRSACIETDLVGRFSNIWTELVSEAIGRVLLVTSVVGIYAHRAVEIDG